MVNNIKAFWRYPAMGMGTVFAFVLVCLGATAIFGPESFFVSYIRGGVMIFFILTAVLTSSTTRSMVNVGLAMGAVRKGMWGAIQLSIVAQALLCLPMQALLDWGAAVLLPEDAQFTLTLPAEGFSGLALFLLLWAMGTLGAWLALVKTTGWRILGWALLALLYLGYIAAMIVHTILSVLGTEPMLWGICGVSLAVGIGVSFGLYRQCRTAQVTLL